MSRQVDSKDLSYQANRHSAYGAAASMSFNGVRLDDECVLLRHWNFAVSPTWMTITDSLFVALSSLLVQQLCFVLVCNALFVPGLALGWPAFDDEHDGAVSHHQHAFCHGRTREFQLIRFALRLNWATPLTLCVSRFLCASTPCLDEARSRPLRSTPALGPFGTAAPARPTATK